MITVVNYNMGNLGSILNMFNRIGVEACIESDVSRIEKAEKILLPGVGAFDTAMNHINNITGLREVLNRKALVEKVPILGVCLGMQLLTTSSQEGQLLGLNWLPASTIRFPIQKNLKVPHMGWNNIVNQKASFLTKNLNDDARFYFVHSYYVQVENVEHSLLKTYYGISFDSAICKDNIYGVQFHPEKSHRFGMSIFKNFSEL